MHSSIAALLILWAASAPASAPSQPDQPYAWSLWSGLPVLEGGRHKPLDMLAREAVYEITGRTGFRDPKTNQKLGPVALYLTMLFEWHEQEQEKAPSPHGMHTVHSRMTYFKSHQADKWDRAALIPVDPALREALGMNKNQQYISPLELSSARVADADFPQEASFPFWAGSLARKHPKKRSKLQQLGVELAERLWTYQGLRMGQGLEVLPVRGSPDRQWMSVAQLMQTDLDDNSDPTGRLRKVKQQFQEARAAYLAGSPQAFNQAATDLCATAREAGPELGAYPRQEKIDLEVAYNRWVPLSFAWWFTSTALVCLALSMATRRKLFYIMGLTAIGASLVAILIGLGMRTIISGWAPVTNLYESVVFMAFGTVIFGLVFGLRSRKQYILAAAIVVATIALVLADCCPSVLNPSIRPLPPVLRSKFWLAVHVITIMLSYAAFAVALGIGNITLGYYLVGSRKRETIKAQCRFTYKSLQAGVLLLIVGTILGALWADYSWGRFWGWDPKEVWALITLLGYLAVLHSRHVGWVGNLGLAALSVVCFAPVLMTWYVVNYMGAGLHDYGFSGGTGLFFVFGAVIAQFLYVAAAVIAALSRRLVTQADRSAPQPA